MAVVGRAQVLITPSFKGFQRDVSGQMPKQGEKAADSFSSSWGKRLKTGAKVAGGAVAGILGTSLVKGFGRLKGIEDARAKLEGLGHSAKGVDAIMKNALDSVRGTAFGLDEAATTAAGAVASGVKPGKELERTLKLVADAATIGGTSMGEMGAIFNKVAASGKIQGDVIAQLGDRGIPILQLLGKEIGKTPAEVAKLASEGKIGFDTFRNAMEEGLGGAALKSGETTTGAFKNMFAAIGRVGANLLSGVFPKFREGFGSITAALGPIEDKAKVVGQALGDYVAKGLDWLADKAPIARDAVQGLFDLVVKGDYTGKLAKAFSWSEDDDAVGRILDIRDAVLKFGEVLTSKVLPAAVEWGKWLADHKPVVIGFAGAIAGLNGLMKVHAAVMAVQAAGGLLAYLKGVGLVSTAIKAWTAVQWALNLAMTANPIGIVVVAVAALVAGLIVAYKHSERFRNIVNAVGGAIKNGLAVAINWITGTAWPAVQAFFTGFATVAQDLWGKYVSPVLVAIQLGFQAMSALLASVWTTKIKPVFDGIVSVFRAVGATFQTIWNGWIKPVIELVGAIVVWLFKSVVAPYFANIIKTWKSVGSWIMTTWKTVIQVAFKAVGALISWLWNTIAKPYFAALKSAFITLGNGLRVVWATIIKPTIDAFGKLINWLWNTIGKPYLSALKSAFSTLASGIKTAYDKTIKPTIEFFGDKISGLKTIFESAVKGIKTAWEKVKGYAKAPVKFVIETVINSGLIAGFNKLAKIFGTSPMDKIPLPKGFRTGGPTGNIDPRKVAGVVHGNEHVVTDEEVRRTPGGHGTWAQLRAMAKHGSLGDLVDGYPGFFLGGQVPVPGRRNRHSGYSWARWAGDIPAAHGTAVKAWKDGVVAAVKRWTTSYGKHIRINHGGEQTLYAHLSKILVGAGQRVKKGQTIGRVGNTGNSFGPHLHFEVAGGSSKSGGGKADSGGGGIVAKVINMASQLGKKFAGPLKKLGGIGGGPFGQLVAKVPKKIAEQMLEYAKKFTRTVFSGGGGGGSSAGGKGISGAASLARSMGASPVSYHRDPQGDRAFDAMIGIPGGRKLVSALLSNRGKFGIKYLIHNMRIWSARNWGGRRYTPISGSGDYRHTRHVHASFYDQGGMLQPGLTLAYNGTKRPEPIMTGDQWDSLRAGGGDTYNIHGRFESTAEIVAALDRRKRRTMLSAGIGVGG